MFGVRVKTSLLFSCCPMFWTTEIMTQNFKFMEPFTLWSGSIIRGLIICESDSYLQFIFSQYLTSFRHGLCKSCKIKTCEFKAWYQGRKEYTKNQQLWYFDNNWYVSINIIFKSKNILIINLKKNCQKVDNSVCVRTW